MITFQVLPLGTIRECVLSNGPVSVSNPFSLQLTRVSAHLLSLHYVVPQRASDHVCAQNTEQFDYNGVNVL